ncbi:hypothetical protein HYPSUDRAFT_62824 [Hypholoma sublateritium FD-334 SS-4]|uniref:PPM-type phosphatase domain-containing protein n=1 Tax=Hypholoma sublateritium (strain FD-334 SS-4) TaxID=945553 RepID=A0A0D2LJE9_HYPSF|nr:hypothetical protein HYPSUDRAFT_62824 [Hypholoma sublateritium FD-334 SS-4]
MQSPTEHQRKTTDMGWPEEEALWWYTPLSEPLLSSELARLADARTHGDTDSVTFQPCPNPEEASQDRFVIADWSLTGGNWAFRAVFDGHAGHETADYAAAALPGVVRDALVRVLDAAPAVEPDAAAVEAALLNAIADFDASLGEGVHALFPEAGALTDMDEAAVHAVVAANGPAAKAAVLRAMRGSTALIALSDPTRANLWVASLGDCAAVLGTRPEGGEWSAELLSFAHNGENPVEASRVRAAHPGEPECMLNDRVLGVIAVTRALGDFTFKLPPVYTDRVFVPVGEAGPDMAAKLAVCSSRNHTTPYMSGVPQTIHVAPRSHGAHEALLIMCSDGLGDLSPHRLDVSEVLAPQWVRAAERGEPGNRALAVLRDALGGDDLEKVSRSLTVEMTSRWMDDTTVLVQRLF